MKRFLTLIGIAALASSAFAAVTPHVLFSDGAVLQQGMPVPVWGTADTGEKVTVAFQGQSISTVAQGGRWMVKLQPLKAGGPFEMTIAGTNTVTLHNMLVGEVWVCSGQSNMEFSLHSSFGGPETLASSKDDMMRLWSIPHIQTSIRQTTVPGAWKTCGPDSAGGFSGVGYFFGRDLRKSLNVPVGLIHAPWGGSPAQAWTSQVDINSDENLKKKYPKDSGWMYNGMIRPIQPFAIRGVIWYQGESNAGDAWLYRTLFPTMIRCWRTDWGQGDFPFLFVQLAPFMKIASEPGTSNWAELREAQTYTSLTVPNTAMAVITDVGEENDIHPRKKEPVGDRLALAARGMVYGQKVEYLPPMFKSLRINGNKAVVTFANAKGGLVLKGDKVTGFAVAGAGGRFYNADATVSGVNVTVSSPSVPNPVAVRYGWANYPLVNLFSAGGLPACPFRTDRFPVTTQPK